MLHGNDGIGSKRRCPDDGHQYALDTLGRWVNASHTTSRRGAVFYCDCPEKHAMKLVKPSGKEGKRPFLDYFAHVFKRQKTSNGGNHQCKSGGESREHREAKHKLREMVNVLKFATEVCPCCGKKEIFSGTGHKIRMELRSGDGRWRYDCVMFDANDSAVFVLEIAHSHFTGREKIQSTRLDGLGIAEFTSEDVMAWNTWGELRNIQMVLRKCIDCKAKDICQAISKKINEEIDYWSDLEETINEGMDATWKCQILRGEISLIASDIEKALVIIRTYHRQMTVSNGRWGDINLCCNIAETTLGFLLHRVNDYSCTSVPSKNMFLVVLDDSWKQNGCQRVQNHLKSIWTAHSVCRDFVLAVNASTVLNRLSLLEEAFIDSYNQSKTVGFKDCLFAILKEAENEVQVCANCGVYGHKSQACSRKICTRCGRGGHTHNKCYAKTSVCGEYL